MGRKLIRPFRAISISIKKFSIATGLICFFTISSGCVLFEPLAKYPVRLNGLAANYDCDLGIAEDPKVIFSDSFENWRDESNPPVNTWEVYQDDGGEVRIIPGKIPQSNKGNFIAEIACWKHKGDQVAGLTYKLGNYVDLNEGIGDGYEELFLRYYIKFDDKYQILDNHGINLGGRDLSHPNAAWVGMAGIRNIEEAGYFFSGIQPAGLKGDQSIELDLYSYHLDKRGRWGEIFRQQRLVRLDVGKWYCVERHLRLNTINEKENEGNYDGLEEVWIDGLLVTRIEGIRYRNTPRLRITFLGLETYYHNLPDEYSIENPIKVFFDNIVVAKDYIGPISFKDPDTLPEKIVK